MCLWWNVSSHSPDFGKKDESEEEEVAELRNDDEIVFDIPYNFVSHKSPSPPQAPVIQASSQGRFTANNGALKGTYQFFFTTREGFILSLVYDATTQDGVTQYKIDRIVGMKQVRSELTSFWQKYGTTILISVFFLGSRLFTRTMTPQGQAPAAANQ